jgi:hypothetical protein
LKKAPAQLVYLDADLLFVLALSIGLFSYAITIVPQHGLKVRFSITDAVSLRVFSGYYETLLSSVPEILSEFDLRRLIRVISRGVCHLTKVPLICLVLLQDHQLSSNFAAIVS